MRPVGCARIYAAALNYATVIALQKAADCSFAIALKKAYVGNPRKRRRFRAVNYLRCVSPCMEPCFSPARKEDRRRDRIGGGAERLRGNLLRDRESESKRGPILGRWRRSRFSRRSFPRSPCSRSPFSRSPVSRSPFSRSRFSLARRRAARPRKSVKKRPDFWSIMIAKPSP